MNPVQEGREGREEGQDADDDALEKQKRSLLFLAQTMVGRIADHENPQALLAWAHEVPPRAFSLLFDDPDPAVNARTSYWLARSVWNGTPLASNGFQPKPLPAPKDEDPCPCGSGDSHASCCAIRCSLFEQHWISESTTLWPLLAMHHKDSYWIKAERSGKLPAEALNVLADCYHDAGRWRSLQKLVEARLSAPKRCNDPLLAEPIECLCDAYEQLHRTPRKMLNLLEQFAEHPTPALRAAANRRLSQYLLDTGQAEASKAAMEKALAAEPDNFNMALFELNMLARMGALERASKRAAEWQKRLKGVKGPPQAFREILRYFAKDPYGAMEHMLVACAPKEVQTLLLWLDGQLNRRLLPRLRWQAINADPNDELLRGAYRLATPHNRHALEDEWLAASGMEKPFSTAPSSGVEMECWAQSAKWLDWLREHPRALDSLTILDDLAMLLDAVGEELHGHPNRWHMSLLVRGVDTLRKNWPPARKGTLPWVVEDNRPALRLLASFVERMDYDWRDKRVEDTINLYLRLNPTDNHGFRCLLVDHLLAEGRDAEALACAERYPNDMFAETRYGEVLALYRLGRLAEAETRLRKAAQHLPLVPKYLLSKRVAQPKIDDSGMQIGGKDQAWLYRDAMREVWMRTKGASSWMSRQLGEKFT